MLFRTIGDDTSPISAIGQGCMGVGGYLDVDASLDSKQVDALKLGIDLGMTLIDTAEVYGKGHSEELVGRAVAGARDRVFIASKVSPENTGYDDMLRSAESSLRRLKTDYIDLYQIHWPYPKVPIEESMRAMEQLVDEGKVRHIGMSNFSVKELREAQASLKSHRIVSSQSEYNLFDRTIENCILPYCEENNILTIAYSPLDQGRVEFGMGGNLLTELAAMYEKTTAQIVLNWLISRPSVSVIPKATNPIHIRDNAQAADFTLSPEDIERINRAFDCKPLAVPPDQIRPVQGGQGNRRVYETVEEARANELGFAPSPTDLSRDILEGESIKPIRVKSCTDTEEYEFDLVEGRIRYWAWVIAYDGRKPVPALIR